MMVPTNASQSRTAQLWWICGVLGLIGALAVGVGEFMVHYNPDGFEGDTFEFFAGVSDRSLIRGHFLVVGFLPLYVFGYLHFYIGLRPGAPKLAAAVLSIGIFAFMIGAIWVGSRAFLGSLEHILDTPQTSGLWLAVTDRYLLLIENLVQALRVLILALSVCFFIAVVAGGTFYPRWFALFTPVVPLAVIFTIYFLAPGIGKFLVPAAMNVAHVVVFSLSLLTGNPSRPARTESES